MAARIGTKTTSFGTTNREGHDSSLFYNSRLYSELKKNETKVADDNLLDESIKNKIFVQSAENMVQLPDNSVHLMITSPPYNVSKDYDDDLTLEEYLNMLQKVFSETFRVLVDGGRVCINVANIGRKPYIPLTTYINKIMIELGFLMRGEIIWNKAASSGSSTAWGSWMSASNPSLRDVHEYILVYSKSNFSRKKGESTISRDQFIEWTKSIWQMKTESAKKVGHPAPFPLELPHRLIQLFSFKNDIILDPFMGSGTTAVASVNAERYYVGYELQQKYADIAETRLSQILL